MTNNAAPILRVENCTMQFGGVVAVDNFSMEVFPNEIVALIGPKYTQVIDTTYINFFPSLGLNWAVNKNSKINFNYTRKISRPSFNNLSPNIRYDNVFFYRQGNPYLLPTITDDLSLFYSFKSI